MLDTFLHRSIRRILKIFWPERVTNEELRHMAGVDKISNMVKVRRWIWLGHTLRMSEGAHPRVAIGWTPEGKRERGRPKETWRRTVEKERRGLGFNSWAEATEAARDREGWRQLVRGPNLHRERRT